jgi:hypothetical protein
MGVHDMTVDLDPGAIRSFGADDHPACPQCGERMGLTRRGPALDLSHERQTFSCDECEYEARRVVDVEGKSAA